LIAQYDVKQDFYYPKHENSVFKRKKSSCDILSKQPLLECHKVVECPLIEKKELGKTNKDFLSFRLKTKILCKNVIDFCKQQKVEMPNLRRSWKTMCARVYMCVLICVCVCVRVCVRRCVCVIVLKVHANLSKAALKKTFFLHTHTHTHTHTLAFVYTVFSKDREMMTVFPTPTTLKLFWRSLLKILSRTNDADSSINILDNVLSRRKGVGYLTLFKYW